jgi:hypothetical protein
MDLERVANEYSRELIELQRKLFIHKRDLNVFKDETIPAIQYCSINTLKSIQRFYKVFVPFLDKNATYLNVGSGTNFLEKEARQQGIFMQCADIEKTKLIFDPIREIIDVPLDFTADLYSEEININDCDEHYDYIMFIRYVPFEHNLDTEQFMKFIKSCKKYADKVFISVVKDSYTELQNFLKQNSDIIIKDEIIQNSRNFIIDLSKT